MKQKLRIGLLVDSLTISNWSYRMIEKIVESNYSEVVLVVRRVSKQKTKRSLVEKISDSSSNFLYNRYLKFENKFFNVSPNAFSQKNLNDLFSIDIIDVEPIETKFSDKISKEDIETIKTYNVDLFIRIGFRILRGEILKCSKYGIWSFHHGDNKVNRGGPAGAWEVLKQWDETGVILQILTEDLDGGYKLYESFSKTDKISIIKNKNNYYWKAASFLPRKLNDLYNQGEELFYKNTATLNNSPYFYYNKLYKKPTNLELLKGFYKNYSKAIKRNFNALFYFNQWILLFKLEKKEKLSQSFFRFKRILPPKDRFWADPFVYFKNDKYYIFLEELLYKEGKGKIAVIEMDQNGTYSKPTTVIEKKYHLSYPFLIEENNELYMIPESSENKTIEIYKCTNFPYKWDFHKVLINNIKAVDTTILKHNGKYWLFCNVVENSGASSYDELFLFYSDSLLESEFVPHPQNPIVSDAKTARPAGNIFEYKGKLFRPAQNCTKVYGYGMQIKEIITLTETEYEEKHIQSIYPNWEKDLIATHTLNHINKLTVIDAMIKRRK